MVQGAERQRASGTSGDARSHGVVGRLRLALSGSACLLGQEEARPLIGQQQLEYGKRGAQHCYWPYAMVVSCRGSIHVGTLRPGLRPSLSRLRSLLLGAHADCGFISDHVSPGVFHCRTSERNRRFVRPFRKNGTHEQSSIQWGGESESTVGC